jgi:threonine synthase
VSAVLGLVCSLCGSTYGPAEARYNCPRDGGNLDVALDYSQIRRAASPAAIASSDDRSLWRYLPLLPVADPGRGGTPLRSAGWTPL